MVEQARARAGSERRAHPRAELKTSVHFGSESNFYTGFTQDISEGGLFVATHNVLPVGTVIDLEFSLADDEETIHVQGEVRWAAEYNPSSDCSPGLGVRFLQIRTEDRSRIDRFVQMHGTLFFED